MGGGGCGLDADWMRIGCGLDADWMLDPPRVVAARLHDPPGGRVNIWWLFWGVGCALHCRSDAGVARRRLKFDPILLPADVLFWIDSWTPGCCRDAIGGFRRSGPIMGRGSTCCTGCIMRCGWRKIRRGMWRRDWRIRTGCRWWFTWGCRTIIRMRRIGCTRSSCRATARWCCGCGRPMCG